MKNVFSQLKVQREEAKRKAVAAYWANPGDETFRAALAAMKARAELDPPPVHQPEQMPASSPASHDHLCHCGQYGTRAHAARPGRWFCAEHDPQPARTGITEGERDDA